MVAVVGSCIHLGPSSREPESPAETGLPGLCPVEKCPARVHVCVGTYARVARAALAACSPAAFIYRRGDGFSRKIFFLVNAPTG